MLRASLSLALSCICISMCAAYMASDCASEVTWIAPPAATAWQVIHDLDMHFDADLRAAGMKAVIKETVCRLIA